MTPLTLYTMLHYVPMRKQPAPSAASWEILNKVTRSSWTILLGMFCFSALLYSPPLSAEALDRASTQSWIGAQNVYVPRLGRVRIVFPRGSESNEGIKLYQLEGELAGSKSQVVVSYSIAQYGGPTKHVSRELLFRGKNSRTGRLSFVRVTARNNAAAKVASVPSSLLSALACGTEKPTLGKSRRQERSPANGGPNEIESPSPASKRQSAITIASGPRLRVAFVTDSQYSRRFGSGTEQHVVTMLGQVNAIYTRDLGLTVVPVLLAREKTETSRLRSTDSSGLLDGFAALAGQARYGDADIYHLLTGKDLSDNIIGLANLPGACAPSRSTRVSLSQYLNPAVDYMTVAHELGHNLSADHDTDTEPATLMYPSLPVDDVRFSNLSRSQIARFRSFSDIQRCFTAAIPARTSVGLTTRIDANGGTSLSLSMPTGSDSCRVVLEASKNSDFSGSSKVNLVSMESLSLRVFSSIKRRSNRERRVFIRATANCGGVISSARTSIAPTTIRAAFPRTSENAFANAYINSFR
jgi:hypothetical protein